MCESFCGLASQAFSFSSQLVAAFFDCTALGPTVILRAFTCLDKDPETGGFNHVIGVVGFISIFMFSGDSDQLMNGPIAAAVTFFLMMFVK